MQGTSSIGIIIHPVLLDAFLWTKHRSMFGAVLDIVPPVETMVVLVHIHAYSVLVTMA